MSGDYNELTRELRRDAQRDQVIIVLLVIVLMLKVIDLLPPRLHRALSVGLAVGVASRHGHLAENERAVLARATQASSAFGCCRALAGSVTAEIRDKSPPFCESSRNTWGTSTLGHQL